VNQRDWERNLEGGREGWKHRRVAEPTEGGRDGKNGIVRKVFEGEYERERKDIRRGDV
jgi:hypothetical protein